VRRKKPIQISQLLSKIEINDNKLLPDNTLNSLGKMALGVMTNITLIQVLIQSELTKTLSDKEALNEFVAFRRDYMDFAGDKTDSRFKEGRNCEIKENLHKMI
jgi:hypothetical protein